MNNAVIVEAVRTPLGRYATGSLANIRPDDLAVAAVTGLLERVPQLDKNDIGDLIMGCAFPEISQGWNLGRRVGQQAGLPVHVPGITINRWCSSSLNAVSYAADQIKLGYMDVVIAAGAESMTNIPLGGKTPSMNPSFFERDPEFDITVGLTAEKVAELYHVTREMQDELAYRSWTNAERADDAGLFKDEIVPVYDVYNKKNVEKDDIRRGITREYLAAARPVFKKNGTVTAPNSSQMTDAASAVLVMSEEKAKELGLKPMGCLIAFAAVGCPADLMGLGPIYAIPKALKMANMTMDDIDLWEINEAFAAQAVACINELGIDPLKVNVNGGACALGHPTGATGCRLTTSLLYELRRSNKKYGVVSMCVGHGQGAAGIYERL